MKFILLPLLWVFIVVVCGFLEVLGYVIRAVWVFDFQWESRLFYTSEATCCGWYHLKRGPIHYLHLGMDESHGKKSEK